MYTLTAKLDIAGAETEQFTLHNTHAYEDSPVGKSRDVTDAYRVTRVCVCVCLCDFLYWSQYKQVDLTERNRRIHEFPKVSDTFSNEFIQHLDSFFQDYLSDIST